MQKIIKLIKYKTIYTRDMMRPEFLRDKKYLENFDHDVVFYDLVQNDKYLFLIGPPLRNLKNLFNNCRIYCDGNLIPNKNVYFNDCVNKRTQESYIKLKSKKIVKKVLFKFDDFEFTANVRQSLIKDFSDQRILITKSKDNELNWIRDWILWHQSEFKIETVIIYNNNTNIYSNEDLLNYLKENVNVKNLILIAADFKFGPQGGRWENKEYDLPWEDFFEYTVLQHAKFMFFGKSKMMINNDIDELIYLSDRNISSRKKYIVSNGTWVSNKTQSNDKSISHSDFLHCTTQYGRCTNKYIAFPFRLDYKKTIYNTHNILYKNRPLFGLEEIGLVNHFHFRGISTNWKYNRNTFIDESKLFSSEELKKINIKLYNLNNES